MEKSNYRATQDNCHKHRAHTASWYLYIFRNPYPFSYDCFCFKGVIVTLMNIIVSEMLSRYTTKTAPSVFLRLGSVFFPFWKIRVLDPDPVPLKTIWQMFHWIEIWCSFFFQYNVKLNSYSKVSRVDKTYLRNCPGKCVIDLSVNSF